MELREKMYVRTKLNDFCNMVAIRKIIEIDYDDNNKFWVDDYVIDTFGDEQNKLNKEDIEKASENIIDVIEIGDYVNGYKIDYINLKCETPFLRSNQPYRVDNTLYSTLMEKGKDYNQPLHFYEEDIKDVITKEQFNSMKYVVERDK